MMPSIKNIYIKILYIVSFALLAVFIAALVRYLFLGSLENKITWLTFYPAIIITIFYGGFYSGMVGIFFSCLLIIFGWKLFASKPFISNSDDWLALFFFIFNCILISLIAEIARNSKKKAQKIAETLIASETRYRRLFETAKDGIIILDADTGMIMDVNPFLIEKLGYSKEQFLEKEIWEIGFLKDIIANKDKFSELQQNKYVRYEDLPLKTADGKQINVEFVSNVYLVNNHKVIQCNIRDITERKRTENAYKVSEAKYRAFFENSMDAILLTLPDGGIASANPSACTMFGYTESELISGGRASIVDITDIRLSELLKQREKTGKASGELTLIRKDGTQFPAELTSSIFSDANDQLKTSMIVRDISERKMAEIALRASEFSLKNAQAVAKIGSWETNLSDLSVIWSEEIYHIFEIDKDVFEASHPAFLSFVHPDDKKIVDDAFVTSLENHSLNIIDHQIITPSGLVKFVEERWQIVVDDNGKPLKAVGTCQDISERKIAEIAISESEEKFRSYIENMPDGVFIADENGKYLEVNKAACQITGYSETELLNMTVLNITSPESLEKAGNEFLKVMSTGFGNCELHYRHKNSTDKIWSIDGVKLSDTRILGFVKDITDRKKEEVLFKFNYYIQTTLNSILQLSIKNVPLIELLKQTFDLIINVPSLNLESKGCIFLANKKEDALIMVVEKNLGEYIKKACKSVPFGLCHCGRAASTQENQFSNRLNEEHKITYNGIHEHGHYCIPIVYAGKTLGVINIYLKPNHIKNKTEINFLHAIANTLAGIIVRKNSEDELQKTLDNLEITVSQRTEELNAKNIELKEEIEERINIENELSESEEKFRNLIEDAVDSILQFDINGNFIRINNVSLLLTGYSKDELLNMKKEDLFKKEDLKYNPLRYNQLNLGEIVHVERNLIRKDNSEVPVEINAKKMPDGTYQSIIRDISERKRFENELKKMAVVVEQNPVGIVITKPDGAIEYINNNFLSISGYTKEELLGNKTTLLKSGIHDNAFHKELWDTILSGKAWKGIICNKNKSSELYWEQNTIAPVLDDNGTISNFIAMKEDVTKLKRTEEELIKSKESAEDANRMKSEFLANMSHEIRTPLNAIVGFSSILKEKTTGQKVFTEYLDNIMQSSKVLLSIINDILDLSKIESGRMVIDYQPVNLNSIILELKSVFQMKAKEKGITLNILISKDIPDSLITDEKFLRQILFNLIGNAVKFTNIGSVEIAVNIIPKDIHGSKVDLIFVVKDTGIGIPEDQLNIIFDPFIQVIHKNRNKYGGTGLGLSITKRLVELIGGKISVESKIGFGSTFSVSLFDLEISSFHIDENKNNHKLLNIKFHNPIILMAEDILSNRQVIKGYLEPLNVTIIETLNGAECINATRKNKPDLILMDMQMPVMDGFTAINILKSDNLLKHIPVIALSASGMKQQRDEFQKVADEFLIKPIYKNELLEKLIKYLPYEELSDSNITLDELAIPKENKLSIYAKKEMISEFTPLLAKLQNVLNIDELQDFVQKLVKFNEAYNNSEINEYSSKLENYINSFNIEKIHITLKSLNKFITQ